MSQPPYGGWNVPGPPPPPGPPRRRLSGRRIAGGIGAALGGHAFTLLVLVAGLMADDGDLAGGGLIAALVGQAVLFVACLAVGITLMARQEPGFGVGLLIGWAVGLLVVPFAGFGLCVWALEGM